MATRKGADAAEVIVRPSSGSGWRIETASSGGAFVAIVSIYTQAFYLTRQLRPTAHITLLLADESRKPYATICGNRATDRTSGKSARKLQRAQNTPHLILKP